MFTHTYIDETKDEPNLKLLSNAYVINDSRSTLAEIKDTKDEKGNAFFMLIWFPIKKLSKNSFTCKWRLNGSAK